MSENRTKLNSTGKVVYNNSIVRGIILIAINEVEGACLNEAVNKKLGNESIVTTFNGQNVSVDVNVCMRYGYNLPDVAYNLQKSIKHNVETMTDYKIKNVDVHVVDIAFEDDSKSAY